MSKNPRKISLIGSRATSVLSVALVLIVIGLCATTGIALHRASAAVGNDITVIATVLPGEDPLRVSEIKRIFNKAPWVDSYEFTPSTEVLSREAEIMDDISRDALSLLSANPFGDEFVIHPSEGWRNTDSIHIIIERVRNISGIDIVSGNASAMGQANEGLQRLMIYLAILALVLLVISVALINNTISLSIYSRRFNIHTMKLVGATNAFIRRPFVRAGTLTGFIAGVIAAGVIAALQGYLYLNDAMVGPWLTPEDMALTAAGILVTGALIARIAAWRAANNYLRKSYDKLFRK